MKHLTLVAMLLVLAVGAGTANVAAEPTNVEQSQSQAAAACFLPKTKFVLHAGLAFGAFHRYLYKPFKAHAFTGASKVKTIAKAAAAALFVYHETNEALKQAHCSKTLTVLVSPLTAVVAAVKSAGSTLKSGGVPDIGALGSEFDAIGNSAGGIGVPIKDIAHGL